jgi:hypothetical protein
MRIVLMSTVMLMSALPLFAQNMQPEMQAQNPAAMTSKLPAVTRPPSPSGTPSSAAAEISPDTPVMTLEGVCDQPGSRGTKDCKTVITRARIDSLVDALAPDTPPASRRRFAISYARLLAASGVAQGQHLEKDPAVAGELQAQLELVRMEVLANALYHQMQQRADNVPASEIEKYYMDHKADYYEGDVRRLSIPSAGPTIGGQPLDAVAVKAKMGGLRTRAEKGDDFDQLQQDGYAAFGIPTSAPPTQLTMVRRTILLPGEREVFDLNAGEVTQILESEGAFVILKLESKHPVPIEAAQSEIKTLLQQERMAKELQAAAKNIQAQFNLAYLDMPSAPDLFLPSATPQPATAKAITSGLGPRSQMRRRTAATGMGPRVPPSAR